MADEPAAARHARPSSTKSPTASPTTTTPSSASCRALYADLEDGLAAIDPAWSNTELPSFIRMGSWIGGDRDGNPFVNADVLRQAIEMQSKRAFDFYLDELHLLGAELSLDRARVSVSAQLEELVEPHARRFAAPRGRALSARHRRHLCAARRHRARLRPRRAAAPRGGGGASLTRAPPSCAPISTSSIARCVANGSAMIARGRLRMLRRAVEVFGFHLASIDLRQNSDVHERVLAELFETGVGRGLSPDAGDSRASRSCWPELATARPLISPFVTYSEETAGELDDPAHRRRHPPPLRQGCRPELRDLQSRPRSPTCSKSRCC